MLVRYPLRLKNNALIRIRCMCDARCCESMRFSGEKQRLAVSEEQIERFKRIAVDGTSLSGGRECGRKACWCSGQEGMHGAGHCTATRCMTRRWQGSILDGDSARKIIEGSRHVTEVTDGSVL